MGWYHAYYPLIIGSWGGFNGWSHRQITEEAGSTVSNCTKCLQSSFSWWFYVQKWRSHCTLYIFIIFNCMDFVPFFLLTLVFACWSMAHKKRTMVSFISSVGTWETFVPLQRPFLVSKVITKIYLGFHIL